VGLGDFLAREFGVYDPGRHAGGKIELCHFTPNLKVEIFSKLRIAFERRALRIPSNPEIREDLHGVRRITSSTGQITYRATQNADGHSDRCTALALALRAVGEERAEAASTAVELPARMQPKAFRRSLQREKA
jgi:phage FluMu gp28-like protein